MKLYSPQQLAEENPHLTARWIRDNAEQLGFKRVGNGRGKWLASGKAITEALEQCSTNGPTQSITTSNSSSRDVSLESPLAARIGEMRNELKSS